MIDISLQSVNRYDWIALLDVDEVIVPQKHNSWAEMMEEVSAHTKKHSYWSFKKILISIFPAGSTGKGSL